MNQKVTIILSGVIWKQLAMVPCSDDKNGLRFLLRLQRHKNGNIWCCSIKLY